MEKSVLITGGSRGIGAAAVREFTAGGWKTAFLYEKSDEQAAELAEQTGAERIKCDVSCAADVVDAVKTAKTLLGITSFDVLVCNAGISVSGLFTDLSEKEWERISGVNVDGVLWSSKAVLPDMISRKSGAIVTVSSMWGQTGAACEVAYSTTKAAVIGFTKALAAEAGPSGIRVNAVAPGVIDTDMNKGYSEGDMKQLADETPLCRIGTPEEVAKAVLFLASDEASFITGQVLGVNGGFIL